MPHTTRLPLLHNLTNAQKDQSGVFVIRNTLDARVYVGTTQHLGKAANQARYALRAGAHGSDRLQAFVSAHGFNILSAPVGRGQRLSPEACARISAGKKGKPIAQRTAAHQEKLAAAHRGRKRSEAARANMRGPRKPKLRESPD